MKGFQSGFGHLFLSASLLAAISCGGSQPAAQTAPTPDLASASPAPSAPPAGPEPASSAELLAGIKAFDAGNFADARRSLEAASKKDPKNYEALFDLGMACEKTADKPAAESSYKAALSVRPDLEAAAAALSALEIDEGRFDDAMAVATAGLGKHSDSAPLHENLALAMAGRGDRDGAIKEFGRAVEIAPLDAMLHLTFAHSLNTWHVRGAAPHLDVARDHAKDDYGLLAAIALEYRLAGEFDSCVKTYDRAVSIKDGGEVRTGRGLCKLGLKDEKGMLDDLKAAVATEPGYAPAHYYLAGRLAGAKHFKEAAAEYDAYLELDPNGSLAGKAAEKLKAVKDAMKDKSGKKK